MLNTPGGKISSRPLYFNWLCDCSGSMSINGKMDALNRAIKDTLPGLVKIARENPNAAVLMRAMKFSHGASWINRQSLPISDFVWTDLVADQLETSEMDVTFLIDTSGSMSDEIEGVKKSCQEFADHITGENIDVRIGLIGFDIGGHSERSGEYSYKVKNLQQYTIGIWGITTPEKFKKNISGLKVGLFGGMGCYIANSDSVDIFPEVVKLFEAGRKGANRVLVLISDEMGDTSGLNNILRTLRKARIRTYVLGVRKEKGAHQMIAKKSEGVFWDIEKGRGKADFSSLLENIGETIAQEAKKKIEGGIISSGTDMGRAVELLAKELSMPPMPQRALPPVNVLISDGKPTDYFADAMQKLLTLPWGKKSLRIAIGIGRDADIATLRQFISNEEIEPLIAYEPDELIRMIRWASSVALKQSSRPKIAETN